VSLTSSQSSRTPPDSSTDALAFTGVGIDPEPARQRVGAWSLRNGIVLALLVEVVFFWSQSDKFMTTSNVKLVMTQMAATAVMAVPVGLLLLSGYIDFAVGSTAGLAGAFMGIYLQDNGGNALTGVLVAVGVGALVGGVQGLLATKLTLAPIIITLGFYTGVRGLVFVVSDGKVKSDFGDAFSEIGRGTLPGTSLPNPIIIAAALLVAGWIFHTRTKWGRHVVSLGVNSEAARRAGISLYWLPFLLYVAAGAAAGLAADITASRLDAAPPTLGEGFEIDVLSAVLLGGVAFGGGKGSMVGVAAGVLFIGFLNNGLLLMGAPPFWLRVSSGAALVAAAALDGTSRYVERRRRGGGR
jgi:ribose transport system permease protein